MVSGKQNLKTMHILLFHTAYNIMLIDWKRQEVAIPNEESKIIKGFIFNFIYVLFEFCFFTVIYTYPCFTCIIKLKEKRKLKVAKENSY